MISHIKAAWELYKFGYDTTPVIGEYGSILYRVVKNSSNGPGSLFTRKTLIDFYLYEKDREEKCDAFTEQTNKNTLFSSLTTSYQRMVR